MAKSKKTIVSESSKKIPVTRGSGNVFADLGFDKAEAKELQMKAELTRQIYNQIKTISLTQIQAAARLGISQPDVSKLMHGRYTGFSVERLIDFLNALEIDVEIILHARKRKTGHYRGTVSILEAAA